MPSKSPAYRVLVVDDEAAVRRLVADGLTELGFHVTTASDGGEAQRLLGGAHFDAMVLDLKMAPVGGWEVVEFVRDNEIDVATVLLSAYLDVEGTVSALRAGVFDVLQKPLRLVELSSRIRDGISARKAEREGERPDTRRSQRGIRLAPQSASAGTERLVGQSAAMKRLRDQVLRMGRFREVPTHIVGATGTGKSLLARVIHELSCAGEAFITVSSGALPPDVLRRELFGYEQGAFPEARSAKVGSLQAAAGGTLFLKDVESLPHEVQSQLALALDRGTFRPEGASEELPLEARIISSTTHPNLADAPATFRPDLYSKLTGLSLRLPELSERQSDIEELATHFLQAFGKRYTGLPTRIDESALAVLRNHAWPGNVWELRATIEQAAVLSPTGAISGEAVQATLAQRGALGSGTFPVTVSGSSVSLPLSPDKGVDLNAMQREITVNMFNENGRNLARTARALGIPRTTLRDRLRRYGEL